MSVSYWRLAAAGARSVDRADVVVVGAGVVGLSAALELERRGVRVIVVDRHGPGAGASSRNAGFLMRGAAEHYGAAVRAWGRDAARTLWRGSEENLELLRRDGVEELASFAMRESCVLGLDAAEADELGAAAAMMREDGFAVELIEPGDPGTGDAAWRHGKPRRGLVNPGDAVVNPAELISWMASRLREPVRTLAEVAAIEPYRDSARVVLVDGAIDAGRVLVCTNAWAGELLPELRGLVVPNRGQMLALRAPELVLDRAYYANRGSEYFRSAGDGVVVMGGCRVRDEAAEVGFGDEPTAAVQGALDAFAADVLGLGGVEAVRERVIRRWAGTMGFSPDGLPIVGAVRAGVFACVGMTGHGMSLGVRSAHHAVDVVLGDARGGGSQGEDGLFSPARIGIPV